MRAGTSPSSGRHNTSYSSRSKDTWRSLSADFKPEGETLHQQLVSLVVDCIVAHETAYENCNLIHRDVSFGNLLAIPRVRGSGEKKYVVCWQGLLLDWALARDRRANDASHFKQTGTSRGDSGLGSTSSTIPTSRSRSPMSWSHSSMSHLHHGLPGEAQLPPHPRFLNIYLDEYVLNHNGEPACPVGKHFCITVARLSDTLEDLLFGDEADGFMHMLHELFRELLALIRARYIVLKAEERKKANPPRTACPRPHIRKLVDVLAPWDPAVSSWRRYADLGLVSDPEEEPHPPPAPRSVMDTDPTPEVLAQSRSSSSHASLRTLLQKYMLEYGWPPIGEDIAHDRLKHYTLLVPSQENSDESKSPPHRTRS
ncbi:hypothetical protein OH76DRAFT_431003 [Lentinus brumalis]|uniref:Fungal-type protein kinase domain-containing protein n=1 Tax=Lentinus brumalis TaxID=2498619 RepID=A0A371DDJ0_9APHY|nr:hypothetical protein OH76DRAFT_431003 [Polyporus brumalis]